MVDSVSAEVRIKKLLEESRKCGYPVDPAGIKHRYKDTALTLFRQSQEEDNPNNYLTFGTRRSSAVSQYGNTPIVIRRSRSSNGELATVVEQVPSMRGRSSVSDYTLVESREQDEENSDTEEELDTSKIKNVNDVGEADVETQNSDLQGKKSLIQNRGQIYGKENSKAAEVKNVEESWQYGLLDIQSGDHENRKSFSHYNLPLQRFKKKEGLEKENCEDEGKEEEIESRIKESDIRANEDNDETAKEKVPETSDHRTSSHAVSHDGTSNNQMKESHQEDSFKINNLTNESQRFSDKVKLDIPEIDHEAVLRDYIEKSSFVNGQNTGYLLDSSYKKPDEFKFIELKIVESSDNLLPTSEDNKNVQQSLTTDMLNVGDDDDVVFIDANSPLLMRTKIKSELSIGSSQEILHTQDDSRNCSTVPTPTPPKRRGKSLPDSSPPLLHSSLEDEGHDFREEYINDINKTVEPENRSGLLDLPVRSPTPPKRSPRRSPRTPKLKDKNKQQSSSLVLTSDDEVQEVIPKGISSAPPTSKSKETSKIFSFSLKREKSKSASSLNSKKGKDKQKLSALKSGEGPVTVTDPTTYGHMESCGKRVGVRSMVIDGTIKQNFIVIHPSDDSETIGLAPLSPGTTDRRGSTVNASIALSSVKSHITGLKSEKLESVKRISSKGDLKEELINISGNGGSLNLGPMSKSLRAKKNKKAIERRVLGSSRSLSSEPTNSGSVESQVLFQPPLALSEVDCDSVNIPSQVLDDINPTVVSRFCVIM